MKKIKMVCKKPNSYGHKRRQFGDEVEVNPHDVRLVTALGWFVPMEPKPEPAPEQMVAKVAPKIQTRALSATSSADTPAQAPRGGPVPASQVGLIGRESDKPETLKPARSDAPLQVGIGTEPVAKKPRRVYQRRDLNAET